MHLSRIVNAACSRPPAHICGRPFAPAAASASALAMGGLMALALLLSAAAPVRAAAIGVRDNAHIFKQDAIDRANQIARDIEQRDKRQVLVETYASVPEDQRDQLQSKGNQQFFKEWTQQIARQNNLSGILVLICMDPRHIEVTEGNQTQTIFSAADRSEMTRRLVDAFKAKQYDRGLDEALQYIDDHMTQYRRSNGSSNNSAAPSGGGATGSAGGGGYVPPPRNTSTSSGGSIHIGGWVCLGIAVLLIFLLVRGLSGRNRTYGGGYGGAPPAGGYPPGTYPQQGGYPPPGYGTGGGGGGFGRGLLGGILGGALGSWGYDRMTRGSGGGYSAPPPMPGGGGGGGGADLPPDTSYSNSGGDFEASGGGGGDAGGGGADFGSSGGDFGGGGGGGGDMGGGGGGDSGSSGGDF